MELIQDLGMKFPNETSKKKYRYGIYKCPICGNLFETMVKSVLSGKASRCRKCGSTKHIVSNKKIYQVWWNMKGRCYNKNNSNYKNYGERNISICEQWLNSYQEFENWCLLNGFNENLTIDRIDVNGNYEPSNCRFVKKDIQAQNTRLLRDTNTSGYRGVNWNKTLKKWVSRCYVNKKRISIGYFDNKKEASIAYDNFVIINKLQHPLNKEKKC